MSEDTIIVDDDMRSLLEDLKTHYVAADDGHLIRAVLRETFIDEIVQKEDHRGS